MNLNAIKIALITFLLELLTGCGQADHSEVAVLRDELLLELN